jgi:hypothetical protein
MSPKYPSHNPAQCFTLPSSRKKSKSNMSPKYPSHNPAQCFTLPSSRKKLKEKISLIKLQSLNWCKLGDN